MLEIVKTVETKSGQGAKGPWTLYKITTESDKKATAFTPAEVGDEVELSDYNEQYHNYKFKKLEDDEIDRKLEEGERMVKANMANAGEESKGSMGTRPDQSGDTAPASTDVVSDINKLMADAKKSINDSETLSIIAVQLATRYGELGTMLAESMEAERGLELELKYERAKLLLSGRKSEATIMEAQTEAYVQTKDKEDEWRIAKKSVDMLKIKRSDVETLIDVIRSRLAVIREDINNG